MMEFPSTVFKKKPIENNGFGVLKFTQNFALYKDTIYYNILKQIFKKFFFNFGLFYFLDVEPF